MRKVKYIPSRVIKYTNLTIGNVYDVVHSFGYIIYVINDSGVIDDFYKKEFVDVTSEYRAEVIDDILL